jgi:hypothetical protein
MTPYERGARRHTRRIRLAAASGAGALALAVLPAAVQESEPRKPIALAKTVGPTAYRELPPLTSRDMNRAPLPVRVVHRAQHHRMTVERTAGTSVWARVAACESSGNWADNTGNGYFGGVQMDMTFWRNYGGTAYAARPDLASEAAQIVVARRGLAVQGPGAWPVCGPRAGLARGD